MNLTTAQREALAAFFQYVSSDECPRGMLSNNEGVSRPTVDALVRKGLAEVYHDTTRKSLARAGWTDRTYTEGAWRARLTEQGLAVLRGQEG